MSAHEALDYGIIDLVIKHERKKAPVGHAPDNNKQSHEKTEQAAG